MKRIEGHSSDSDERLKRPRMSDIYDGPSTSRMVSPPEFSQNITNTGCTYNNSIIVTKQIMDKKTSDVVLEQFDGFPFTPQVFIGRTGEIQDLLELIEEYPKVLITGIGGMGKTRLAIECARQWVNDGKFTRAIFINVETEQGSKEKFKSLGERLNVNTEVVKVYNYFNECPGLTLFVLDNVEPKNKIGKFLPPKNFKNLKILATSQDCEYELLFRPFKLNKLTEDKALELVKALFNQFQREYKNNGNSRANLLSIRKQDIPAIQELVKELDGHPLALQHATALCVDSIVYNREDELSQYINTYLTELKEKISEGFSEEYEAGYNKTIFASISLNVQKAIVKSHVRDFLFTMCFMNPTFIELKYFRTCGYFSEDQIKECRRALQKHSIIHFRDDNLEDINVHRLVLFICLTMLRNDKLEERIVDIIARMFFCDKQAYIYHGSFLFQNTNLEKKDLAGPYINAFKKSLFMSKLRARLQWIDLTVEDLKGWTVLHYCMYAGHEYWFDYFNETESSEIGSTNLNVFWPFEIVDLLKGNDVYLFDVNCSKIVVKDLTALHFYAAFGSNLAYFEHLIDKIEDEEIEGSSRLFNIATRNKNYNFGFELLARGAKYEDKNMALMCAVLGQDLDLIRTFIKEGADVKFTDDAGISPVFLAIVRANDKILKELQQQGADVESALNSKDGIKNTALLSVIQGHPVASYDYPNKEFHFIHDLPCWIDKNETKILPAVELLIKNGAHLNCVDRESNTPLMIALRRRYVDVAVKLIEFGADVNKANDDGGTPLMLAKKTKVDGSLIKLLEERVSTCEGSSAPTTTLSDLIEPIGFLNKYWKWRLKFLRKPCDQMIHQMTCQKIQTHLEESQKNLKKFLQSTSDPSFKASIQDLDKKIEMCVIDLKQREKAIDELDFSSFAKILVDNLNASIKDAIYRSAYDAPGVLKTLAEFIFETRFQLPANLIDLYDKYVDIKFENVALRSEKTSDNDETEVQLDAVRRVHQKIAVRHLLPEEKSLSGLKKFKIHINGEEQLVRIGILTLTGGQLKYLNSSVAEYFFSEYLISNFNSEVVQTMFLHKVLMENKFKLTRQFFDGQLELFFENEELVQNKSDEISAKQLNCLKRNRFDVLARVKLTDKVKETVRLTLQGDKDFLLLKRVEDEGRTHIIKYLVINFQTDLDILLKLIQQSVEDGVVDDTVLTYLSIETSERTDTFKALLYYMIENLDKNIFIRALRRLLHYFSSKGKTESLKVFLVFLKDKLDQKNLVHLLEAPYRYGKPVLYVLISRVEGEALKAFLDILKMKLDQKNLVHLLGKINQTGVPVLHVLFSKVEGETLKVFLEILKQNLDKKSLFHLLNQTNRILKRTVLHVISEKADNETLKEFFEFLRQNLDKDNLGNLLQQTNKNEDTALHLISDKADSETLNMFLEFLKQNLDKENLVNLLHQTNKNEDTALHLISEKDDREILQVFLKFLKIILDEENLVQLLNQTNYYRNTALHLISGKTNSESLKVFLEFLKQNLDEGNLVHLLNQTDNHKNTVLHVISKKADSKTFKVFLEFLEQNLDKENLGNLLQQTNENNDTALHLISDKDDSETLKVLVFLEFLKQNLDKENLVNLLQKTNRYKNTALHVISRKADSDTLKVFLEFMKQNLDDMNLEYLLQRINQDEDTVLHIISEKDDSEIFKVFLEFLKQNLNKGYLEYLLKQSNQDEDTVLHIISRKADSESLKMFLEFLKQNLNERNLVHLLNQTNRDKSTVLHDLSKNADSEAVKLFLEFLKENLNKENLGHLLQQTKQDEDTVLHTLSGKADSETLKVFLEFLKQNLSQENLVNLLQQTNQYENTALHTLSVKADSETLKVFLEFLKQNLSQENLVHLLNQTNNSRNTVLHALSSNADSKTLKVLSEFLTENLSQENIQSLLFHQSVIASVGTKFRISTD